MESLDYSIHYARFHPDTEEHAAFMAAYLGRVLGPHLPQDQSVRVLDVGCGFGYGLRALQQIGYPNITGLEISSHQAERARRAGFDVALTDDTEAWLRSHASGFGAVLLLDVLEHLPVSKQIGFASAICAALEMGGRVLLTVPNALSPVASERRYVDFTHYCAFSHHSLHFVLRSAGFSRVFIEPSPPLGPIPKRLWKDNRRSALRHWLVRWWWRQVFLSELPWENIDSLSFEPNLFCVAAKE